MCNNPNCQNNSTDLKAIEKYILNSIQKYFNYTVDFSNYERKDNSTELFYIDRELKKLTLQLNNIFDLLEQKIYNRETFLERKQVLEENINILNSQKEKILSNTPQLNSIDSPITILELYNRIEDIKSKNRLLKNIFSKIYYSKIDNNIEITIYSKIPIK